MSTAAVTPALDWQSIARATLHPTQVALLQAIAASDKARSPNELAAEIQEPLGNVSYHVRQLRTKRLVRLVRTTQRRGALEHYYKLAEEAATA